MTRTYEMLIGEPPFTGPTAQAVVAKVLTERWRRSYNTVRPHSSLGGATPDHFAATTEGARRLPPARPERNEKPAGLSLSV